MRSNQGEKRAVRRNGFRPALVAALVWIGSAWLPHPAQAEPSALVGAASNGQHAWEFVAQTLQDGTNLTHFGYLTRLAGLDDGELFSDAGNRTEATARFTFVARTALSSRHELGNLIVTAAPGAATFYFQATPGADFAKPDSFARGQAIAGFTMRFHNVLNVQAANEGVSSATIELVQEAVHPFRLNGRPLRFGHKQMNVRMQAHGQGTRTQVEPLEAFFLFGGSGVATQP
jgi:hypothetical protein